MDNPFNRKHTPTVGVAENCEPGLQVLTAPNASPMTFTGTQTYILGHSSLCVIDPGPEDDRHLDAILKTIGQRPVSHIFVTHAHIDHSPLARRLSAATDAPVYGFGPANADRRASMDALSALGDLGGTEGIDAAFVPDVLLKDGDVVQGDGWTLEAVHTPGHLSNHLCFAWRETNAVFSGDHVMGWATTMVSPPDGDLTSFMESLKKMANRPNDRVFYPGHGAPILDPAGMIQHQIKHRKSRESQILDGLKTGPSTALALAQLIYTDIDQRLIPAAARNVFAHLIDLTTRDLVAPQGPISTATTFAKK